MNMNFLGCLLELLGVLSICQAAKDFFCYQCVSPLKNLDSIDMRMKLNVIMRSYFIENIEKELGIIDDCDEPKNISRLPKKRCNFPVCYELRADDYIGRPFYTRGCGELFMTYQGLQNIKKSECRRNYENFDIRECYCIDSLCNINRSALTKFSNILIYICTSLLIIILYKQ